jgi:hypothetical protein
MRLSKGKIRLKIVTHSGCLRYICNSERYSKNGDIYAMRNQSYMKSHNLRRDTND